MLKSALCSLALAVPGSAVRAAAGSGTQAVVQLVAKLKDGGCISGTPLTAGLPFQTEYARTEIPWSSVAGCSVTTNDEPSLLHLKNGDQLRGRIGLEKIALETVLGKLMVATADISALSVRQGATGGGLAGLILYFPFDEDGGDVVRDASGHGNDGKVLGAQFTPEGKIGGAYGFKGQSNRRGTCIQVANSPSLRSPCETKQLSIAVWLKPGKLAREYPSVICMGGNMPPDAYGGYELYLHSFGGEDIRFNSGDGEFITRNTRQNWVQDHIGEWIHIAVTVDVPGKQRAIYVNGIPTGDEFDHSREGYNYENCERMLADLFKPVQNDLFIGKPDPNHHYNRAGYTGLIDEVMIFNRALPAEEVLALYQRDGPMASVVPAVKTVAGRGAATCKVRADLVDGSVLVGEIKMEGLGVRSATLGKVSVPLAPLRELKFSEEGKLVQVKLGNGDVLIGAPLFGGLKVTTAFGPVALLPAHVRLLTVISEKNQAPTDVKKQPEF
jgi:hypothetical protein